MKIKTCDKKAEIIDIGTELISVNGYNATGLDAILRKAGVPKGSFYHYFRSKEDFGLAVIDQFAEQYDLKLASFFDDTSFSPIDRIRNYFEHSLAHLTENQFTKGCLIGNLGQELADQNERFRARLEDIFQSWKNRFSACLAEAQQQGDFPADLDPNVVADFILAAWEGAILRAKVMKTPESIRNFIDTLFLTVLRQE
ncbi:MAG: TetR family transcriptional regulator C-terminal domain-containing protein [Desulfobulbus sp.]|nr:TetR family transcriptional regulator C-terminal domain-containing protein [Desulfobulbus sp.]